MTTNTPGGGKPMGNKVPIFTTEYVENMREGFLTTLKVLKTMFEKAEMKAGVEKCDELIKQYSKP